MELYERSMVRTATGTGQIITIGAASAASTALPAGTTCVRLVSSVDCYIEVGSAVTAATTGVFLPAGTVEYFQTAPGEVVACIQVTAGGSLYVSPMK